jgi:hypothetical protein
MIAIIRGPADLAIFALGILAVCGLASLIGGWIILLRQAFHSPDR